MRLIQINKAPTKRSALHLGRCRRAFRPVRPRRTQPVLPPARRGRSRSGDPSGFT
jgi:hypothetical protein